MGAGKTKEKINIYWGTCFLLSCLTLLASFHENGFEIFAVNKWPVSLEAHMHMQDATFLCLSVIFTKLNPIKIFFIHTLEELQLVICTSFIIFQFEIEGNAFKE